ncbi:hypothetical protein CTATCC11996_11303 [Comamonas testosteroni ATCC 11996]|nr:hypothetical protein CTATCC11996_11303 [Comamonas testosteroni ATCC 11996]
MIRQGRSVLGQYLQKLLKILVKRKNERNLLGHHETCVLQDQDFARRLEQQLNAGSLIPHNFTHVI